MVRCHEDYSCIQKFRIQLRSTVPDGIKPHLTSLLKCLLNKLVIRAQINNWLAEFIQQRLCNQQPDKRLPASGIELDDEVALLATVVPRCERLALSVPEIVDVRRFGESL